jgi:hypothetical protein
MNNQNWEQQYNQSTPKLLPPTVFERSSELITTNNDNETSNNNPSLSSLNSTTTNNNNNSSYFGESQIKHLSNELEKFKLEIRQLYNENETLRNKNRGLLFLLIFYQLKLLNLMKNQ